MNASPFPPDDRRTFLEKLIAATVGVSALLVPVGVGLSAFVNPLRKLQGEDGAGFLKVAKLDSLPADGTPQKIPIIADRVDAWNKFVNEPVGSIYLRRVPGKPDEVVAFQVVCPHAGCAINYQPSPDGGKFFCPCHAASFDVDGKRMDASSPSPRDMDVLELKIEGGDVLVKFQNFVTNKAEKVAQA